MTRRCDITYPWDPAICTPWCDGRHNHDPACWGWETETYVNLSMEDGYPHDALPGMAGHFDPPRIGVNPYREEPGLRSVVYLHVYRPHESDYRNLDDNLQLTGAEARTLAANLLAVADIIDPQSGAAAK